MHQKKVFHTREDHIAHIQLGIYMYTYKVLIINYIWRSLLVHGGRLLVDKVEFSGFRYDIRKEKSHQLLRNCFYAVFW